MNKVSLTELASRLDIWWKYVGNRIRHGKTGSWYMINGFHFRESDLAVEFTYTPLVEQGAVPIRVSFSRPIKELFDGRWSEVDEPLRSHPAYKISSHPKPVMEKPSLYEELTSATPDHKRMASVQRQKAQQEPQPLRNTLSNKQPVKLPRTKRSKYHG